MGNVQLIPGGKFIGAVKSEQTTRYSKYIASDRRINIRMVQNVHLIWLDTNIVDNSADCRNTITRLRQLQSVVHTINIFTDPEECVQFLKTIRDKKACLIISGSLGQHIVPYVHDMSQVTSIFIFCINKKRHKRWAKEWPKIEGVFTTVSPICETLKRVTQQWPKEWSKEWSKEWFKIKGVFTKVSPVSEALKQAAQQCEQNAISISFMATDGDSFNNNLNQLDPSFMYTQILKEILLTINFEEKNFIDFIEYCRDLFTENQNELNNADELERTYRDKTPIWWYTSESFLYPMLNRSLRLMDVNIIIKMGFFVADLHRHIEQLYSTQFNGQSSNASFTVYRGQGMSKTEFEQMCKTKHGLISFNNFLSTSKNRDVSLEFAHHAVTNPDLVGILFVMTIDPVKSTTPFASITDVSYFQDKEDEVLFSMNTVFRIHDIRPMDENHRLFQVELTITSDNDQDLCALTDRIREETFPDVEGWYRLGLLLLKIGQFDKAEEVYEILLERATEESEKSPIYHQIASIKNNQGEYEEAIKFFEKDLEISEKTLSESPLDLTSSYNNIGMVHFNMGEYSKALSYYEKYLEIRRQSLPSNHPDLAASYNNTGVLYKNMNEYSKALSFHEQALEIQQQSLPPNHPDLAASLGNIGLTYMHMGEYSNALCFLEKTLAIQQHSLPRNHPHLAYSYNNISLVYENMNNYSKAHTFYECAMNIAQQTLPSNHPDLQMYRKNFDRVKEKL